MGTAMAYGIFPAGPPVSAEPLAALFLVLGLGFALRATRTTSCHRPHGRVGDSVQAVGNLSMAAMQMARRDPHPGMVACARRNPRTQRRVLLGHRVPDAGQEIRRRRAHPRPAARVRPAREHGRHQIGMAGMAITAR